MEKDGSSRMCPGKKDYKVKRTFTVRYHEKFSLKFLTTIEYKISLTTFYRFWPFWVGWANIKNRNTCKCVIHAKQMIMKLHENKVLPCWILTKFWTMKTSNVYSSKCLLRECECCANKMVEFYLPQPNTIVTYEY